MTENKFFELTNDNFDFHPWKNMNHRCRPMRQNARQGRIQVSTVLYTLSQTDRALRAYFSSSVSFRVIPLILLARGAFSCPEPKPEKLLPFTSWWYLFLFLIYCGGPQVGMASLQFATLLFFIKKKKKNEAGF